jgi:predicted MFS family arabinose efflux permease
MKNIAKILQPTPLLMLTLMAVAMQLSHQTWHTLLNNFTIQQASFTGREIGILQSVREIPGFLAFGAVLLLVFFREQSLALLALTFLGAGVAITGFFPNEYALYATTLFMSIGFHYYETMNQSLSLQWLDKRDAAYGMGKVVAAASFASLVAYGMIYLIMTVLQLDFKHTYLVAGSITLGITFYLWRYFPHFPQHVEQQKKLVLRRRYWLYYALTFMGGARRQIFIVFAGFMMVEKFGYSVTAITTLFLINHIFNMFMAPKIGKLIIHFGERNALTFEYIGLVLIFISYAFVNNHYIAAGLYLADHAFFAMAIAIKTYFQKIADPADIAPTAGVAFSINHIAAVGIPVIMGIIWLKSPGTVFLIGAAMAFTSLLLSRLIPANPAPELETVWTART